MLSPIILYELIIIAFLVALLGIVLVNLLVLPKLDSHVAPVDGSGDAPEVAILVPARNEEAHIEACLRGLLAQNYPNFKVWLYDDGSTDATSQIAARIAAQDPRLQVVTGSIEPPPDWLGKAHACWRLYEAVRAQDSPQPQYVLFTDADVRFGLDAVSHAVGAAQALRVGLLSVFPRQVTVTWAERLAVPMLLHWAVYSFLPLPLAFWKRTGPAYAAANGQFMLFTRQAYEACGGHEAVRSDILEDVGLARAVKRAGYRAMLADGGSHIITRMYEGPGEVWRGYSKNAYAFFGYSPFFLAIGVIILLALYISPVALAAYSVLNPQPSVFNLALAGYVLAVVARVALAVRFKYRVMDALLHPVATLFLVAICVNSMVWSLTGRGGWKGRAASASASASASAAATTTPPTARDQSTPTTKTGA